MKAILLAAGVGSRIASHISSQHKCLLPLTIANHVQKEIPLICYTIETLQALNITDISVVTGYLHEKIEQATQSYHVNCFFNPFYYLVNSIGSLWFAEQKISLHKPDDLLILNADTFMEQKIFAELVSAPTDQSYPLLLVDSFRHDKADVKVTYHKNKLLEYGKEISNKAMAESTDVFLIPKSKITQFRSQLQTLLEKKQHNTWWESTLVDFKNNLPIIVQDIAGQFWSEIDYYDDYQRICEFVKEL